MISNTREMNLALVIKWIWKISEMDEWPSPQILQAKYLPTGPFFSCNVRVRKTGIGFKNARISSTWELKFWFGTVKISNSGYLLG